MNLIEKIKSIYPDLTDDDFAYNIIVLSCNDKLSLDAWNHPTLARPTDEEFSK